MPTRGKHGSDTTKSAEIQQAGTATDTRTPVRTNPTSRRAERAGGVRKKKNVKSARAQLCAAPGRFWLESKRALTKWRLLGMATGRVRVG
jgi:hypothetical protein